MSTYDEGFGTGEFGEGLFGKQDVAKYILWDLSVSRRIKRYDREVGYHLRDTLLSIEIPFERMVDKVRELPNQVDPLQVKSAKDNEISFEVVRSETITSKGVPATRIYLQDFEETFNQLTKVTPHRKDGNGQWMGDGWNAVINSTEYPVLDKDSYENWIDIQYQGSIPSEVTVRPFSLLDLLCAKFHIHTHKADPVDWKRRALYRQNLIRQWKVAEDFYSLIGRFYGYDVSVNGLYCLSDELCEELKQQYPDQTHDTDNGCFTEQRLGIVRFDEVAADVIPTDTQEDFFLPVTILSATEADPDEYPEKVVPESGTNFWVLEITKDVWDSMNDITNFYITDSSGVEHKIESNEPAKDDTNLSDNVENEITVLAEDVSTGSGEVRYEVVEYCSYDYKRAAAYWVDITPDEVSDRNDLNQTAMIDSIVQKIDRYIPTHVEVIAYNLRSTGMTSALQSGSIDGDLVVS